LRDEGVACRQGGRGQANSLGVAEGVGAPGCMGGLAEVGVELHDREARVDPLPFAHTMKQSHARTRYWAVGARLVSS
jgi:hypothetical protein